MTKRYEDTSYGGGNSRFQTTEWTKILDSGLGGSILAELYTKYWRPVYSYLRRKGFSNEEAKDLIQGFFSEKVLGQQLLLRADRTKGRFRTFLLTAVKNYAIDLHRKQKPMQEFDEGLDESGDITSPEAEFDLIWAQELLKEVLQKLEAECRRREKDTHWEVFRAWLLDPKISDAKIDMSDLCAELGIDDASKAYNMIANLKGRFRKILRDCLRRHVGSDAAVDDEINHFIEIFSRGTARY
ncbi:MAG: sigma-70 family RNA polymerase sigma factor [Phycisphaerales bacterium]|nr:MAG: sigma-70 family RNA polymerase sigma factor [Phycisphaerales bacterium]